MNRVKGPVATNLRVAERSLPTVWLGRALTILPALMLALMAMLAGCATPDRPAVAPAPVVISPSTWRQVDRDIFAASLDATGEAEDYARELMQRWRNLVYQRTDAEFIPWFSSYWTRQWLTMKVTWYQLNAEGGNDPVDRLAGYLQKQYQDQVLEPVAKQISPPWIRAQTTQLYIRLLREQLRSIPPRYSVPQDQFDGRLQDIPAITLAPSPTHGATLYQIVNAEPIDSQPGYVALLARIDHARDGAGSSSASAGLASVAKMTSESLISERTTSGVAGAVSSLAGRAAGLVISLGTAGFSAMLRENQRPKMEAELRKNVHAAFDKEWLDLMSNPDSGVLAGVRDISAQIESGLADSLMQPEPFELAPETLPLPGEPILQDGRGYSDEPTFYRLW